MITQDNEKIEAIKELIRIVGRRFSCHRIVLDSRGVCSAMREDKICGGRSLLEQTICFRTMVSYSLEI